MVSVERIVMELVVTGGNAKALALAAVEAAKNRQFEEAKKKLMESKATLAESHHFQTELIQAEMEGKGEGNLSLIMVHGQDHLMNAMTVWDLAQQMVAMYEIIYAQK